MWATLGRAVADRPMHGIVARPDAHDAVRFCRHRRLTADAAHHRGPAQGVTGTHAASSAKQSPKTTANSLRATCQYGGGLRHLLSTPRSAR